MKTQITDQKIQEVADKIVKEYQPEKIILFGSYAWGTPHKDSDVDLFVIKETNDVRKTSREMSRLIFPRLFPIDLIVYTPAQLEKELELEEPFVSKIAQKGKILFSSEIKEKNNERRK